MRWLRRFAPSTSTFRRGPRFTLDAYAQSRGFHPLGRELPRGAVAAVGLDPRHRFNVMQRPDAAGVVLAHVLEPFAGSEGDTRFRPWTVAAIALPEAIGSLVRVNVRCDHKPTTSAIWRTLDSARLGLPGHMAEAAPAADEDVLAEGLAGGAADWLARSEGWLALDYGCLWLAQQRFVGDAGALDEQVATLETLADRLRRASLATLAPSGYPPALPAPSSELDLPVGAWEVRDWIPAFAERRGLVAEDPLAFHRALPRLPLTGHAFGVFRGPRARLVTTTEVHLPQNLGDDAALCPVPADAPACTAPWALRDDVTAVVDDGVLIVKRTRMGAEGISGPALLELAELAVAATERRAWPPGR